MYLGIPIVMRIPQERGFLFSSAVLAISLVILVSHHGRLDSRLGLRRRAGLHRRLKRKSL
jgi:hypothetical protein